MLTRSKYRVGSSQLPLHPEESLAVVVSERLALAATSAAPAAGQCHEAMSFSTFAFHSATCVVLHTYVNPNTVH